MQTTKVTKRIFLLFVLTFNISLANAFEGSRDCGLEGSIGDRIVDCFNVEQSSGGFILVYRKTHKDLNNFKEEFWKDVRTGQLVSYVMPWSGGYFLAERTCNQIGKMNLKWRLPDLNEMGNILNNGYKSIVSVKSYASFWTSSWDPTCAEKKQACRNALHRDTTSPLEKNPNYKLYPECNFSDDYLCAAGQARKSWGGREIISRGNWREIICIAEYE